MVDGSSSRESESVVGSSTAELLRAVGPLGAHHASVEVIDDGCSWYRFIILEVVISLRRTSLVYDLVCCASARSKRKPRTEELLESGATSTLNLIYWLQLAARGLIDVE